MKEWFSLVTSSHLERVSREIEAAIMDHKFASNLV